jgi:hypothetical protein
MSFIADSDQYIPHRIALLEPDLLSGYSSKQRVILRTVFAMINGQRTIEQIKGHLHLSPKAVDEALNYLHWLGVVE